MVGPRESVVERVAGPLPSGNQKSEAANRDITTEDEAGSTPQNTRSDSVPIESAEQIQGQWGNNDDSVDLQIVSGQDGLSASVRKGNFKTGKEVFYTMCAAEIDKASGSLRLGGHSGITVGGEHAATLLAGTVILLKDGSVHLKAKLSKGLLNIVDVDEVLTRSKEAGLPTDLRSERIEELLRNGGQVWKSVEKLGQRKAGTDFWIWPSDDRIVTRDGAERYANFRIHWRLRPGTRMPASGELYQCADMSGSGTVLVTFLEIDEDKTGGVLECSFDTTQYNGEGIVPFFLSTDYGKWEPASNILLLPVKF